MAQANKYKGRLGFEHRSEELLSIAFSTLSDTLDEMGHPLAQVRANSPYRIELDCDHYAISLRSRRMPMQLGVRAPLGLPAPSAYIELTLVPHFPEVSDGELNELLLAALLRELAEALDPLVIFWMDAPQAMSCPDFLGVFQAHPSSQPSLDEAHDLVETTAEGQHKKDTGLLSDDSALILPPPSKEADAPIPAASALPPLPESTLLRLQRADIARAAAETEAKVDELLSKRLAETPVERGHSTKVRTRGKACFAAVDDMAPSLVQRFDTKLARITRKRTRSYLSQSTTEKPANLSQVTSWAIAGLVAMFSAPVAVLMVVLNLLKGGDMRLSARSLSAVFAVLFLQSSGMVQAAAKAILP